jgi:MFS family permease
MVSPKKFLSSFLALYFLVGNLIGGMGPVIVGALTDHFGPDSIRYTLMSVMILGYSTSFIFYTLQLFVLKRDILHSSDMEEIVKLNEIEK